MSNDIHLFGCLAAFDKQTGRLNIYQNAKVLQAPGGIDADFMVMGERTEGDVEYFLISHDGFTVSRIKKELTNTV